MAERASQSALRKNQVGGLRSESANQEGNIFYLGGAPFAANTSALPAKTPAGFTLAVATGYYNLTGDDATLKLGIGQFLPSSDVGNAGEEVMADVTRDEMKAEIRAASAETDVKIARFEGKLDLVLSKLDSVRDDYRSTRANQWVIGGGLAILIVAVAALFPVFFSIGSQIRDLVQKEVQLQISPSVPHSQAPAHP